MTMEYADTLAALFTRLGEAKKMVLATARGDRVTARMMSCVVARGKFYCQTDRNLHKFAQITANPNVALCADNIQVEGAASAVGHPLSRENGFFAELFERHYKNSFAMYTALPDEVLLEIAPTKITLWEYDEGKPYRLFLDIEGGTARKEYY